MDTKIARMIAFRFTVSLMLSVILFLGYLFVISYPFEWGPLADSSAFIETYIDQNANGIKDKNEPPLDAVCVWGGPVSLDSVSANEMIEFTCSKPRSVTDGKGQWGEFKPGSRCEDLFLFAVTPEGYRPTTDLAVNGCEAKFGFTSTGSVPQKNILTLNNLFSRKVMEKRIKLFAGFVICVIISIAFSVKVVPNRRQFS